MGYTWFYRYWAQICYDSTWRSFRVNTPSTNKLCTILKNIALLHEIAHMLYCFLLFFTARLSEKKVCWKSVSDIFKKKKSDTLVLCSSLTWIVPDSTLSILEGCLLADLRRIITITSNLIPVVIIQHHLFITVHSSSVYVGR